MMGTFLLGIKGAAKWSAEHFIAFLPLTRVIVNLTSIVIQAKVILDVQTMYATSLGPTARIQD